MSGLYTLTVLNDDVFGQQMLNLKAPVEVEFPNSIDTDEAVHNELPHQDVHCLSSILCILTFV